MRLQYHLLLYLLVTLILSSCNQVEKNTFKQSIDWQQQLQSEIKRLGHRNWIVVADAAYPLQSNPGIKTITSNQSQLQTLQEVTKLIANQKHIKPNILLDKEIDFVTEADAQGIREYREALEQLFGDSAQKTIHEEIIGKLDQASELFNVIIIKTDFTIPYTTVFFELDCKYWNPQAEQRLRKRITEQAN